MIRYTDLTVHLAVTRLQRTRKENPVDRTTLIKQSARRPRAEVRQFYGVSKTGLTERYDRLAFPCIKIPITGNER